MPSLQQIKLKDCSNIDMERNTLTGSDILQKHSINSLLEQNVDIINRGGGLASSSEASSSIGSFDIFGSNSGCDSSTNNNFHLTRQNNNSFSSSHSSASNGSSLFSSGQCRTTSSASSSSCSSNFNLQPTSQSGGTVIGNNQNNSQQHQTSSTGSNNNNNNNTTNMNQNNVSSCNNNQMQSTKAVNDFQFDSNNRAVQGNNASKTMSRSHLTLDCTPASPHKFAASPLFGNSFNTFEASVNNLSPYNNSSYYHNKPRTMSPFPDYNVNTNNVNTDQNNVFSSLENQNILDLMNFLNLNQNPTANYGNNPMHNGGQTSTPFGSVGSGGSGCTSPMSPNEYFDVNRMQNYQQVNALRLLQHQKAMAAAAAVQQQQQNAQLSPLNGFSQFTLNHLMNFANNNNNTNNNYHHSLKQMTPTTPSDIGLDRFTKFNRNSAALNDPSCTWSGVLPIRSHRLMTYSPKVFLGGIPWDISETSLVHIFKQFGPIRVEWPGKDQQLSQPKGYAYIIFESEKHVKALLNACNQPDYNSSSGSIPSSVSSTTQATKYYFKISSKRIKSKQVEIIPWVIADSNYVKSPSQKLDPSKTVFVGALHGKLTAEGLAKVMNDLFDGVVYAGIDTDKYKYPIGSGRVTFNNTRSYMKAVSAAFIEIKTSKFSKKVQVDPYLDESLCSTCGVQQGPYYCREMICFRYFCRTCWATQHNSDPALCNHKPLTRNSKSTQIIGVGPQQYGSQSGSSIANTPSTPTTPSIHNNHPLSVFSQHI